MCAPIHGQLAALPPAPRPKPKLPGWQDVGDFWNDPKRWDHVADSHKEVFWAIQRDGVEVVRRGGLGLNIKEGL
jgi:hypothetical protein